MTKKMFVDCLTAAQHYGNAIWKSRSDSFMTVVWNYMPPSAGSNITLRSLPQNKPEIFFFCANFTFFFFNHIFLFPFASRYHSPTLPNPRWKNTHARAESPIESLCCLPPKAQTMFLCWLLASWRAKQSEMDLFQWKCCSFCAIFSAWFQSSEYRGQKLF